MRSKDDDFVQGIKNKDKDSLCKLMDYYGKLVNYIASKILNDSSEKEYIDECYDDVFSTIWFNIECFNSEKGNFKSWLISITKYKALDIKRKHLRTANSLEYVDNINTIQENYWEKIENIQLIESGLENVDDIDKIILIKRYYEGFSIKEIATDLNLSEDYIYTRISRARKKMRNMVGDFYGR